MPEVVVFSFLFLLTFSSIVQFGKAVSLTEGMMKSGTKPDLFSFTAIVNACQRANEAEVAFEVFRCGAVLCGVVLCCAVLCCAALCCAVLCCAVLAAWPIIAMSAACQKTWPSAACCNFKTLFNQVITTSSLSVV